MVVDNLASVVSVKGLDRERELAFGALERLERRVLAAVPCRVQHGPLRFPVGGGECPEEVVARVATPEGKRVDLDVAGRDAAGHGLLAGVAGDGFLQRIVAPGVAVAFREPGLDSGKPFEHPAHGAVAHGEDGGLHGRCDVGDILLVFVHPTVGLGLEVRRARAPGLPPDCGEHGLVLVVIGFPASFSLAAVDSSVEEVDYVLAGEASRIHNLVDDAGLPGGACDLVALSSDLDVFCLGFT